MRILSLRKFPLSVSLLAASLMLVAPAKAEMWACSYIEHKKPQTFIFTRKGKTFFEALMEWEYKIISETETEIHLYKSGDSDGKPVTTFYALILLKKRKVLEETFTPEFNLVRVYAGSGSFSVGQPIHRDLQLNGKCVIG